MNEWQRRIEAVLFASSRPVARGDLTRAVGQGALVDLLIEDLGLDLEGHPYEVAQVGTGWMLRTGTAYALVIRAAEDAGGQAFNLFEFAGDDCFPPTDQPRQIERDFRERDQQ